MINNMGLHVIEFPTKKWGYVGSIPTALGTEVKATTADIMGNRTHRNSAGEVVAWKFPVFDSKDAAIEFAASKGYDTK